MLRSSNGPYIEIGRLTREDRRETKCTRAFRGISSSSSLSIQDGRNPDSVESPDIPGDKSCDYANR